MPKQPSSDNLPPAAANRWWLRLIFVVLGLTLWHFTQRLIGDRELPGEGIIDMPLRWTAGINAYLHIHPSAADGLLIVSSLVIDVLAVFLLAWSVFGPSIRPFLGLLILFSLRQICQGLIALPAPDGLIWHAPRLPEALGGYLVPSLLVTYPVANDFFFSGHTAMAVYGAVELARFGRRWLKTVAVFAAIFQIAVVIVLRAHWTMDVFAGAVTALYVAHLARCLAPYCDRWLSLGRS